jgi:hypothetical protein
MVGCCAGCHHYLRSGGSPSVVKSNPSSSATTGFACYGGDMRAQALAAHWLGIGVRQNGVASPVVHDTTTTTGTHHRCNKGRMSILISHISSLTFTFSFSLSLSLFFLFILSQVQILPSIPNLFAAEGYISYLCLAQSINQFTREREGGWEARTRNIEK